MRRALKTPRIAARPPAGKALETGLVTMTDLLRLKALARFHARGLSAAAQTQTLPPPHAEGRLLETRVTREC